MRASYAVSALRPILCKPTITSLAPRALQSITHSAQTQAVMLKNPCPMTRRDMLPHSILYHIPPPPIPDFCCLHFSGVLAPCSSKALINSLQSLWAAFAGWWLYSPFANMMLLQKLIFSHPMENQNIYLQL